MLFSRAKTMATALTQIRPHLATTAPVALASTALIANSIIDLVELALVGTMVSTSLCHGSDG